MEHLDFTLDFRSLGQSLKSRISSKGSSSKEYENKNVQKNSNSVQAWKLGDREKKNKR